MKEIIQKEKCTGCTACQNICPQKAIRMNEDIEGFRYPVIDQEKCIDCGLCKQTCPVLNLKSNKAINKCYVGFSKEETYSDNSSSGGIFPLIADVVLSKKGIVIGATLNDRMELKHIAVSKKEEIKKLKGSKYIQSDLGNIFDFVKNNINRKTILFVGTPCQIAGLKSFLKKEYENLICIDLICHGVPSTKLFKKYIKELEKEKNDKIVNYDFRDKSTGWDSYSNTAYFKNSTKTELQSNNNYMKLFLSDVALRESCYNCNFKLGNKYSDITLGDFWGVKEHYPEMYNKKGVSAIIINTDKGEMIFNSIRERLEYKECRINEIMDGNKSLKESGNRPDKRDSFFKDIDKNSIIELLNKYIPQNSFVKKVINKTKRVLKKIKNKVIK